MLKVSTATSPNSKLSPVLPVEGATPASTRRWVNRSAVYCLSSTGGCNADFVERL